ncbi:MAG: glycosyltransferase [Muribaculaceae bacterium]|nr:glycosyltransferase [Muribaculaceae bacterium]
MSKVYAVEIVDFTDKPDILFFTPFEYDDHFKCRDAVRVYVTQENDVPNFNICDYGVSFHNISFGDRSFRLPNYCYHNEAFASLRDGKKMECERPTRRDFCSVVISNDLFAAPERFVYWDRISKYKTVASGGKIGNNVGGPVADKFEFLARHKFNLAFENSVVDGYTTEKITDAFYAGTVPIYWGNRQVGRDFNPDAFISINDFPSIDAAIDYIRQVDEDDELYLRYLHANPLIGNPMLDWEERLLEFLVPAVEGRRYLTQYGVSTDYNNLYLAARIRKFSNLILPNDKKWLQKTKEGIYKLLYRKVSDK